MLHPQIVHCNSMHKSPSASTSPEGSFALPGPRFSSLPGSPSGTSLRKDSFVADPYDLSRDKGKLRYANAHKRAKPHREGGKRVQIFEVLPSAQVNLFHGLPFQKYGSGITQARDLQPLIVASELKVLLDKARTFSSKLTMHCFDLTLFELTEVRLQENFNVLLEETIGLLVNVCNLIGGNDCPLPPRSVVESESTALQRSVQELSAAVRYT